MLATFNQDTLAYRINASDALLYPPFRRLLPAERWSIINSTNFDTVSASTSINTRRVRARRFERELSVENDSERRGEGKRSFRNEARAICRITIKRALSASFASPPVKMALAATRQHQRKGGISRAACIINYINRPIIVAGDGNTLSVRDEDVIMIIRGRIERRSAIRVRSPGNAPHGARARVRAS